jgi:hypothetical protein
MPGDDSKSRGSLDLRPTYFRASSTRPYENIELATLPESPSASRNQIVMTSTTQLIDDETSGQRGQPGSKRLRSTEGWRLGVWIGFGSSSLVLLANIILVCLGARHGGYKDGIGILATGDSRYTSRLSTSCHVAINVFSTVLLSSSNYCMQIMSSPSRQTVDRAHARGQSVDIGIWSSHNLRYMRSSHKLIWLALASSSVLLHLL